MRMSNGFFSVPFDELKPNERENAYLIMDLLPTETYKVSIINPTNKAAKTMNTMVKTFDMYNSSILLENLELLKTESEYVIKHPLPFAFSTQFYTGKGVPFKARFSCPSIWDEASYPFLGHEFHHALKDNSIDERRLRYRMVEVIPIFYELVCADREDVDILKKEILKRRMDLMIIDNNGFDICNDKGMLLQYFNSFYYALSLYGLYKEEPELVLKMTSKVLTHNMNTEELLLALDLYDNGMDSVVKDEIADIKGLLKK